MMNDDINYSRETNMVSAALHQDSRMFKEHQAKTSAHHGIRTSGTKQPKTRAEEQRRLDTWCPAMPGNRTGCLKLSKEDKHCQTHAVGQLHMLSKLTMN